MFLLRNCLCTQRIPTKMYNQMQLEVCVGQHTSIRKDTSPGSALNRHILNVAGDVSMSVNASFPNKNTAVKIPNKIYVSTFVFAVILYCLIDTIYKNIKTLWSRNVTSEASAKIWSLNQYLKILEKNLCVAAYTKPHQILTLQRKNVCTCTWSWASTMC